MNQVRSQSNLEYHCLKGLSRKAKTWAKQKIADYKRNGATVPYGLIRKVATTDKDLNS